MYPNRQYPPPVPSPSYAIPSTPYGGPFNPLSLMAQINSLVAYGLLEAQYAGYPHAMKEIALIAYLMGAGYDMLTARQMVESLEVHESFPI